MKSQTGLVAEHVRLQQWAEQIRRACLTTIEKSEPSFAEWTVPMPLSKTEYEPVEPNMAAVLHSPNGFTLEISNSVEE